MKKFISVLLVFAMMLSFSVISFADDTGIVLGNEYTVTVEGDNVLSYKFVPSETGMYKISAELLGNGNSDVGIDIFTDDYSTYLTVYRYNDESFEFETEKAETFFIAKAGQEMIVEICNDFVYYDVEYENARLSFSITPASEAREITMGSSYDIGADGEWFVLCPAQDGIYNIWSYDSGYASVEGGDGSSDWSRYYYDEIGLDFSFNVKAGEIYAVYISPDFYSDDDDEYESYSMTVNVSDGSAITPSFIETENDVIMIRGTQETYDVYVHPFGAYQNFETLVVEVGDSEIAEVEYDEELECLWITANKVGKTTAKLTEPVSGVGTEIEIEVVSELNAIFILMRNAMMTFLATINDFFNNLIDWF